MLVEDFECTHGRAALPRTCCVHPPLAHHSADIDRPSVGAQPCRV